MGEKVQLVKQHREEHGLNACCEALELSKDTWWYRQNGYQETSPEDEELRETVEGIIGDHPEYGYRRIRVELLEEHGQRVNHKRLRRLLRPWDLALKRGGFPGRRRAVCSGS